MGAGFACSAATQRKIAEAVDDRGFSFRRRDVADLANRPRFLIANPAAGAARQAAKRRIREHCQWPKIAAPVERVYFEMMGWELAETPAQRPIGRIAAPAPAAQRKVGIRQPTQPVPEL